MIEQINTIDYDDKEFAATMCDSTWRTLYECKVTNLHTERPYWWRVEISKLDYNEKPVETVVQHFRAACYSVLKEEIIQFISYWFQPWK